MNLTEYGRILIRRGWIIVLLALLTAASAFLYSRMQIPVYRASQKVLLLPSRSDLGLAEANIRLLASYSELLQDARVAEDIIETLQLPMTPQDLVSRVTVASDQLRLMIQIDVDIPENPEMAALIAYHWGLWLQTFREQANQTSLREDRIDAYMLEYPTASLQRPNTTINVAVGALLGVLLGGVLMFILEYLESAIVRRREDLERLDLAVLASIPVVDGRKAS